MFAVWLRQDAEAPSPLSLAAGGLPALLAVVAAAAAGAAATPGRVPRSIGLWIFCLLPLQASWCCWSGNRAGLAVAAGLVLVWPLALRMGKRFHAS